MIEIKQNKSIDIDLSGKDVISALKEIQGYIDISHGDSRRPFMSPASMRCDGSAKSRAAKSLMTTPVTACIQAWIW